MDTSMFRRKIRNLNRLFLQIRSQYSVLLLLVAVGGAVLIAARYSRLNYLIAAATATGGILALHELHYARRIAESEFIRDLNTAFTGDEAITELWRRLLLDEPITSIHRLNISSYFTFFETLFLLMERGVLRFGMVDDLFRNRFFTAIGNPEIQKIALISNHEAFRNVHALTRSWSNYLRKNCYAPHPGYLRYLLASMEAAGFQIAPIGPEALGNLLDLQNRVIAEIEDSKLLRINDEQALLSCLREQYCLGAIRPTGELVAVVIMYIAGDNEEPLLSHISKDLMRQKTSANVKLILVDPKYQRSGLGKSLLEALEIHAIQQGKGDLACTVHPRNRASKHLFASLGFERRKRVVTEYGSRYIYTRRLPKRGKSSPS